MVAETPDMLDVSRCEMAVGCDTVMGRTKLYFSLSLPSVSKML